MAHPRIGIVLGAHDDLEIMRPGLKLMQRLDEPFRIVVACSLRTPRRLADWIERAEADGLRVLIAPAAADPQLPAQIAAATLLPVLGLLPRDAAPDLPTGIPLARFQSPENAVLHALRIVALDDERLRRKLHDHRLAEQDRIEEEDREIRKEFPGNPEAAAGLADEKPDKPLLHAEPPQKDTADHQETDDSSYRPRHPAKYLRLDPQHPDFEAIERAVECLRAGGVIAVPTDTVYGLAADATQPQALERLRRIKGRQDADKPIAVLIDTQRMFSTLAVNPPPGADKLAEAFWPGALTLVIRKRPEALRGVSQGDSLGVRTPDATVPLAIVSLLGKPLAASSANPTGEPDCTRAEQIDRLFGDQLDLILDAGPTPGPVASTVLSLLEDPPRVLREGVISSQQIAETLGKEPSQ